MKKLSLLLSIIIFVTGISCSQTNTKEGFQFPKPVGYVNDYESVFSQEERDSLTAIIKKHEDETTNQIAIVTIETYSPFKTLFDYTHDLFNTWGIGTKEKNNGVAIVFGKNLKEIRIMVGYGLEKSLTNEEAKIIIDNTIIPEFLKENYYTGIQKGLEEIIKEIK